MSGWMGGGPNKQQPIVYSGLQVSSSRFDMPLALFWGQRRLGTNALWYNGFKKKSVSAKGKGGGGKGGQYDYSADCILALGEGTVDAILTVWTAGSTTTTTTLSALNMTFFDGSPTQAPWSYVVTKYPAEARSYARTAYLGAPQLDLGSSATLPDIGFECTRAAGFSYTHVTAGWINPETHVQEPAFDVLLPDCFNDLLTNVQYGFGFSPGDVNSSDLAQWTSYTRAQGLYYSPLLNTQEKVTDIVNRWAQLSNTWVYWAGTEFRIVPLGDSALSANGATYTPQDDVAYDLTLADFIDKASPVKVTRADPADCYNRTDLQFTDRTLGYVTNSVEYKDQTLVDQFGTRNANSTQADEICDPPVAAIVVQLLGKRAAYIRNNYAFKTSYRYLRLLPGSVVTLTTKRLNKVRVRIKTVEEDEQGNLSFQAEEFPGGVGSFIQPLQSSAGVAPTTPNQNMVPGSVNTPAIVEPSSAFTGGKAVLLVAASGGANWGGAQVHVSFDGSNFSHVGDITQAAVQGVLTAGLPSHADPDTVDTLSVNCTESQAVPTTSVTHADADALRTLSLVAAQPTLVSGDYVVPTNGELLAFGTVTATGTFSADLTYIRRGQYGSAPSTHASGDQFTVVDVLGTTGTTVSFELPPQYIGQPVWVQLLSFNAFENALEDPGSVLTYKYTPTGVGFGGGTGGVPTNPTGLSVAPSNGQNVISWSANPPTDNVTSYTLYAAPGLGASFGSATAIYTGLTTTMVHSGIGNGAAFTYFLVASNAVGSSGHTSGTGGTSNAGGIGSVISYFGTGAPSTLHNEGDLYFDTTASPYSEYVQHSGAWHAGGGGGSPGGTSGQVQYNSAGAFGGFTVSGDGTLNTSTGALTVTKTGGAPFVASATTDTTNATNITSGTLPDAQLSANVPLLNAASNTFTGGSLNLNTTGASGIVAVTANGTANNTVTQYASSGQPAYNTQKSRGTQASPSPVLTNDVLGSFNSRGWGGTAFKNGGFLRFFAIETTPSDTAMGSQAQILLSPIGSTTPTTIWSLDWTNGLKINSVQIVNASGVLQVPATAVTPGSYTYASVTVGADGRITAASNGAAPAVASVFGRTGTVVATSGDYTAAQVTNAADVTAANTFTNQNVQSITGGGQNFFTVQGEGPVRLIASRSSAAGAQPNVWQQSSRGTIASPATVHTGDGVGAFVWNGFGATVYKTGAIIQGVVTDPSPSDTAMGCRIDFKANANGAALATPNTVMSVDTTGLYVGGIPGTGVKIADGSGVLQIPATAVTPGSYTNTNITVGADGRLTAASSGSASLGGTVSAFFDPNFASLTKPTVAGLTLTQNTNLASTASLANLTSRGVALIVPCHTTGGADNMATAGAVPPANTFTLTCLLHRNHVATARGIVGVYIKDSAGKYVMPGFQESGDSGANPFQILAWTNLNTFGSNIASSGVLVGTGDRMPLWLRVQLDGTNMITSFSSDGEAFYVVDTRTLASISSQYNGTAAEAGFVLLNNDNSLAGIFHRSTKALNCYSFTLTNP